ncbi:MAG: hypothetical protein LBK41_09010 [Clostridiales bacterium]|nr:hypothetical protein [Clostridiales bacterium]
MSFWAAVAAALIGWGGLSVHAQTAAVVAKTGSLRRGVCGVFITPKITIAI